MYRVAMLVFPGVRAFDVSVITEVWGVDRTARGAPSFVLERCGEDLRPVELRGGLTLRPDRDLSRPASADLVVVPGLDDHAPPADAVLDALRAAHLSGIAVASLCGGAFTLAQAGLLDGRRAVTHWNLADRLAAEHPEVGVDADALFIEDGNVWTSAGTAAGIDLCIHLVRVAHGAEAAAVIARSMVTAPFRSGTQAQFIEHPTPATDRAADALAAVRQWAVEHLDEALTVAGLARRAGMSARTFARHFVASTGETPLKWLLAQRLARAQKLLERTDLPMSRIAAQSGFGSEVTMRQHFATHLATSPRDYRAAFGARAV